MGKLESEANINEKLRKLYFEKESEVNELAADKEDWRSKYLNPTPINKMYSKIDLSEMGCIYCRLLESIQNTGRMVNSINFNGKNEKNYILFKEIFFDYEPKKIKKGNEKDLFENIMKALNLDRTWQEDAKSISNWQKFCCGAYDAAVFLSDFSDGSEFMKIAKEYSDSDRLRDLLPCILSKNIRYLGFALSCDFLKEIGCVCYGKADTHLIRAFSEFGLYGGKDEIGKQIAVYKLIQLMATAVGEIDYGKEKGKAPATAYAVDKVFWLAGSKNFYESNF